MELVLTRSYFAKGTNGILELRGVKICHTTELPWKQNEKRISCIPEGRYLLRKRHSQKFGWHLEVSGVQGRQYILIHPANSAMRELNGCIAPVTKLSGPGMGLMSRNANDAIKALVFPELEKQHPVVLIVQSLKKN